MAAVGILKSNYQEPLGSWFLRLGILFLIVTVGQMVVYKLFLFILFGARNHFWTPLFHFPNYFRLLLESTVFLLAIEPFYRASTNYWQRVLLMFAFAVFNFNVFMMRPDFVLRSLMNNYLDYAFAIAFWMIGANFVQHFRSGHEKYSKDADLFSGTFVNHVARTVVRASILYIGVYAIFYWMNHDFRFQVLYNQLTHRQSWTADSIFQQSVWLFIMPVLTLSLASQFVDSKKLAVLGILYLLWPIVMVLSINPAEAYDYYIKLSPLLLGVLAVTVYFVKRAEEAK
jgi:hypothetical protein